MHAIDVLQQLWLATLVVSLALFVVAALRLPWRRAFGAELACRLWWLPPLALAVCLLPHRGATAPSLRMPARILAMVSLHDTASAGSVAIVGWPTILLASWIIGALCVLAIAILRQWRFTRGLRHARILDIAPPPHVAAILCAHDDATEPALVGMWRPRIVLPDDFEQRYSDDERALILRHEAAHACRRDGLAGACASLLLAAFWFNPLVWWGERRFRRDRELACDAAVLREQPQARHAYAGAMLKTRACAEVLPAGSFWPGHPVTERIAMLKMSSPGVVRRRCGSLAAGLLSLGACAAAWAADQSLPMSGASRPSAPMDRNVGAIPPQAVAPEYQLDLRAKLDSATGTLHDVKSVALSLCVASGKAASVRTQPMGLDLTVVPRGNAFVGIDAIVLDAGQKQIATLKLLGRLGEPMHAETTAARGMDNYNIDVTPIAGCPARLASAPAKVAPPPAPPLPPPPPVPPPPPQFIPPPPPAPATSTGS